MLKQNADLSVFELQSVTGGDCACGEVVMRSSGLFATSRIIYTSMQDFLDGPYRAAFMVHTIKGNFSKKECANECAKHSWEECAAQV